MRQRVRRGGDDALIHAPRRAMALSATTAWHDRYRPEVVAIEQYRSVLRRRPCQGHRNQGSNFEATWPSSRLEGQRHHERTTWGVTITAAENSSTYCSGVDFKSSRILDSYFSMYAASRRD